MNKIKLTVEQARIVNNIASGKRSVMIFAVAQPVYDTMADIIQALAKDIKMSDIQLIVSDEEMVKKD